MVLVNYLDQNWVFASVSVLQPDSIYAAVHKLIWGDIVDQATGTFLNNGLWVFSDTPACLGDVLQISKQGRDTSKGWLKDKVCG